MSGNLTNFASYAKIFLFNKHFLITVIFKTSNKSNLCFRFRLFLNIYKIDSHRWFQNHSWILTHVLKYSHLKRTLISKRYWLIWYSIQYINILDWDYFYKFKISDIRILRDISWVLHKQKHLYFKKITAITSTLIIYNYINTYFGSIHAMLLKTLNIDFFQDLLLILPHILK